MKVLITGGCGFIGSHLVDRFNKIGHSVVIIDNLSAGSLQNVKGKCKTFEYDTADDRCEEVFRIHRFDLVFHLAENILDEDAKEFETDVTSKQKGLFNMLNLSKKYGVQKFIYPSTSMIESVSGLVNINESGGRPPSLFAMHKLLGENQCKNWQKLFGLGVVILRISKVYGPRQRPGSYAQIAKFMHNTVVENKMPISKDEIAYDNHIYIGDVIDAMYRAGTKKDVWGTYYVVVDQEHSLKDIMNIITANAKIARVDRPKYITTKVDALLVKSNAVTTIPNWVVKYSLEEGLKKTLVWYEKNPLYVNISEKKEIEPSTGRNIFRTVRPYIENSVVFLILLQIQLVFFGNDTLNMVTGIDFSHIYILMMAILYGKVQGTLAAVFSIIIYLMTALNSGRDIFALLYQPVYLFQLVTYLFLGVLAGYVTDKKNRELTTKENEREILLERNQFLTQMYAECNKVKDELQIQIVSSEDSFGTIYKAIKSLDSLNVEHIYSGAIDVVARIMRTSNAAIYTLNITSEYMRLKIKSTNENIVLQNSLSINNTPYLSAMINSKNLYINKNLEEGSPLMAAPIVHNTRIIGMIAIYEMDFSHLTVYYQNLFSITTLLISDALSNAYVFEESMLEKKYIKGTRVLIFEAFLEYLFELKKRNQKYGIKNTLLKSVDKIQDASEVFEQIKTLVRYEDYMGLGDDQHLYILLTNTDSFTGDMVINRLKQKGRTFIKVAGE